MAQEAGYERQIGSGTAVGLPSASPGAFGADVGAGIEQLGGALERRHQVDVKLAADQELADATSRIAQKELADTKSITDMRAAPAAGGVGHANSAQKLAEAGWDEILSSATNGNVRRELERQRSQYVTRIGEREYGFEAGLRAKKLSTDADVAFDVMANIVATSPDASAYLDQTNAVDSFVSGLSLIGGDDREALRRMGHQRLAVAHINRGNATDPKRMLTMIESGAFNDVLTAQQLEQARGGAEVEIRRADAAAQHPAALASAQVRDQVATVRAQIAGGVQIDDATLATLQAQLAAAGDESGAMQMGVMREQSGIRREADVWTPTQFDTEINRLAGLGKRTPEQDIRLATLRQMQPGAVATFNNNPGAWAAKNGAPPPAVNFADPRTLSARASWARSVGAATGRATPLLSAAEVATLRDRAGQGAGSMVEVANALSGFGGTDAYRAAKQVLPSDPLLARLVLVDPSQRASVVNGSKLRQANRSIVDAGTATADVRNHFFGKVGGAFELMDAGDLGAAIDVAKNLYAAKSGGQEWDGDVEALNPYINIALGGHKGSDGFWRGGLGNWKGAPTLLPDGWTQGAFDNVLSRMAVNPNGRNVPVWSDGKPMTAADLRNYSPVRRPDGRYEFHAENGVAAHRADGGIYSVDLEQFGRSVGIVHGASR